MTNEIKYIFVVVIYKLDKNRRRTSMERFMTERLRLTWMQ